MVGGQRDDIIDPRRVEPREEVAELAVEPRHLEAHLAAFGAGAMADIVGRRQADDEEVGAVPLAHLANLPQRRGGGEHRAVGFGRRHETAEVAGIRSEEHTSELQSLMRSSYAVFCLKKKTKPHIKSTHINKQFTCK